MATMSLYDMPQSPPNFDRVGVFYMSFCATWTALVLAGMVFLVANRRNPILKIRGLPLSLSAIFMLHLYWILAQITYPIGMTLPIVLAYDIQYFFMGIWFPLGVALFHASNSRFLYVAQLQKQYISSPTLRRKRSGCNGGDTSWLCRFRNLDYPTKILVYIGLGMILQVLLTIGMWFACRKYHPTFGIPGTELKGSTIAEQLLDMSQGWEWWPSALWQVIWTWIIAPIMIWKAWGIRDTLGWRFQTIGCCLSNLHATPMWLLSMYLPAFGPMNKYFTPNQWIHLSVMMFEVFTILVPCFLVVRQQSLRKKAANSNAKWGTTSLTTLRDTHSSGCKSASLAEKGLTIDVLLKKELGDHLFTMGALDYVLTENPGPLQEFSALRDFSGENIAFLTSVSGWKTLSPWPAGTDQGASAEAAADRLRDAFTQALVIYTNFISPRDAEFPINLSSRDLKQLEAVFERPARILCGEARVDPATPFDGAETRSASDGDWMELAEVAGRIQYAGEIPDGFDAGVFDAAHAHVKYLVLTNTWPKFVAEMQQQQSRFSEDSERSGGTGNSGSTLASRVSQFIHSFM
ncbi:hypothetical protein GGS23DRAFT_575912 [Durotheca rogersii]|uniref:uncharacterized protein n=1 Tax=Durotheca rogersii TaxID=419775 RepID=UPI00221FE7CF|nr:uncharacterized protein GGS23DRAFT_575912 [Durotheca rogersii]KAI5861623.1 hypothetical protein GGS23DRAFT_575912 [Durotheca rogersii]